MATRKAGPKLLRFHVTIASILSPKTALDLISVSGSRTTTVVEEAVRL